MLAARIDLVVFPAVAPAAVAIIARAVMDGRQPAEEAFIGSESAS